MRKDERFRKTYMNLLRSETFFNIETVPVEELSAVVDFIRILRDYRFNGYDNVPLWEINRLFTVED